MGYQGRHPASQWVSEQRHRWSELGGKFLFGAALLSVPVSHQSIDNTINKINANVNTISINLSSVLIVFSYYL